MPAFLLVPVGYTAAAEGPVGGWLRFNDPVWPVWPVCSGATFKPAAAAATVADCRYLPLLPGSAPSAAPPFQALPVTTVQCSDVNR